MAAAVGVGFLLVLGMSVHEPTRSHVHLAAPLPSALPDNEATLTERDALAPLALTIQDGYVRAIPPVMAVESAVACTDGVAALDLCAFEPKRAQPATQMKSQADIPRWPAKDHGTGGCTTGVAALGLCER
jgi:hypothetical protein